MPSIVTDALAGYGILSLMATALFILLLCDEARRWRKWKRWQRHVQQTELHIKCEWCNYRGPESSVRDHEMSDHVQ
jgi:uncharacterized membrane protein